MAVFTAIDGTLLDARTFDAGNAPAALMGLGDAGVPVIPISVMTLDEIAPIAARLGFRDAMVIEAGGAIARWSGGWEVEPCGPSAESVLEVVRDIEDRTGAHLLVYSALPRRDAAIVSGRRDRMLDASTCRAFSEPFLIERGDIESIRRAAEELGYSVRRGRRFFHLCRTCDRGEAFSRLRDELRCDVAVGLGGSMIDAEWLSRTDIPIIVPAADGPDADLAATLPDARIAPAPGPAGWAAAVDEIFDLPIPARRRAGRA